MHSWLVCPAHMNIIMEVFRGTLVHSTWEAPVDILTDKLLVVREGKIVCIEDGSKQQDVMDQYGVEAADVHTLSQGEFLMPGFVDTHIHAPQYVYTGTNLDLPLLEWLHNYTYPVEASFSDVDFAREAYQKVVSRVVRNGTTTACWFATIHLPATMVLCDVIEKIGQRAYVGKVSMNQNAPGYYLETTEESVANTEQIVKNVMDKKNPLLTPVVTPRFAVACDFELLSRLGDIAHKYNVPIQSHLCENKAEIQLVQELFPQCSGMCDVYHQAGLFTDKTVMAHGVYLSDDDLEQIKTSGVGISHCPNSNTSIRSGICDVRRLLDKGIKVGLGTDVSGGYSPSMLNALRLCEHVSDVLAIPRGPDYCFVDYKEAFRMATLGGSAVLGLADKIGNFEVGKQFDALRVCHTVPDTPYDLFPSDTVSDAMQKFIHLGDDRNITEVYVAGKRIHSRS